MAGNELKVLYFNWMYRLVMNERNTEGRSYRALMYHLNQRYYEPTIDKDENRSADGLDLRYRFGYENHIEHCTVATYLDDHPCSILEMMIALAVKCEQDMSDPDMGDRTNVWFWDMLCSLGLDHMDDEHFDEWDADDILDRFLDHKYDPDGSGGLFTIKNCDVDLRHVELWWQLSRYENSILEMEGAGIDI